MPRVWRALRGYRRLSPPQSRVGVAWPVVAGIAARLIANGFLFMAVYTILCFGAYLRPSEGLGLRGFSFVMPDNKISPFWSLLISASVLGVASKTGTMDDSVIWDCHDLLWMAPVFSQLRQRQAVPFWPFDYPEYFKAFKDAAKSIGVSMVPYQLRHAGPSWDRIKGWRTLEEIQKRGHWAVFASMARYEKSSRIVADYHMIPVDMRLWMERVADDLEQHVCSGLSVPSPPCPPAL